MTNSIFKIGETNRQLYASYFDQYSLKQLNTIPKGFSNNLIWNIGHVIVAQQLLIYRLSNVEMYISDDLVSMYKPGSRPTRDVTQEETNTLRAYLGSLIEKTRGDWELGKFVSFTERMTNSGFLLTSLQDAFEFNNYHEGLHLGIMMSIKKFV